MIHEVIQLVASRYLFIHAFFKYNELDFLLLAIYAIFMKFQPFPLLNHIKYVVNKRKSNSNTIEKPGINKKKSVEPRGEYARESRKMTRESSDTLKVQFLLIFF